jgi:hypothetical protein
VWSTEHNRETTASPASIWRLWSNVATWREWNADIERIEMSGPFAAGSTISMSPIAQDTVELRIAEASEPNVFGRSTVTYRMEISGDFPETLAALTERAEAMDQDARGEP